MEKLDKQTIHQVWQRVQQQPREEKPSELAPVLSGLRQEAALYTQLIRQGNRTQIQPLLNQVNAHMASIKGMMRIMGQTAQDFSPPSPRPEPVLSSLLRAYGYALERLTEYEKRTSDPSFGAVFRVLASETRNTLRTLTQIVGTVQ